jgi:hypothetical protein
LSRVVQTCYGVTTTSDCRRLSTTVSGLQSAILSMFRISRGQSSGRLPHPPPARPLAVRSRCATDHPERKNRGRTVPTPAPAPGKYDWGPRYMLGGGGCIRITLHQPLPCRPFGWGPDFFTGEPPAPPHLLAPALTHTSFHYTEGLNTSPDTTTSMSCRSYLWLTALFISTGSRLLRTCTDAHRSVELS